MAVVPLIAKYIQNGVLFATWLNVLDDDTGEPLEAAYLADKSVQVEGTLGVGGSLSIEGSNDGTNYSVLTDPAGNALTTTAVNYLVQILENPRYIRPHITIGDGNTDLNVYLIGVALRA